MSITYQKILRLFDDNVGSEQLLAEARSIPIPQRLTWLYVVGNIRGSKLADHWYKAVENLNHKNVIDAIFFNQLYKKSADYLEKCGVFIE